MQLSRAARSGAWLRREHGPDSDSTREISLRCSEDGHLPGLLLTWLPRPDPITRVAPPSTGEWSRLPAPASYSGDSCWELLSGRGQVNLASLRHLGPSRGPGLLLGWFGRRC